MITNGVGTDFIGIGLVEVLWKVISGIINRQKYCLSSRSMTVCLDFAQGEEWGPPPSRKI